MIQTQLTHLMDFMGADEFVPIFTYVLLHSNIPNLIGQSRFIQDFYDEDFNYSLEGYLFTQMEVSGCSPSHLNFIPFSLISSHPYMLSSYNSSLNRLQLNLSKA
jgi:hypothetical protein